MMKTRKDNYDEIKRRWDKRNVLGPEYRGVIYTVNDYLRVAKWGWSPEQIHKCHVTQVEADKSYRVCAKLPPRPESWYRKHWGHLSEGTLIEKNRLAKKSAKEAARLAEPITDPLGFFIKRRVLPIMAFVLGVLIFSVVLDDLAPWAYEKFGLIDGDFQLRTILIVGSILGTLVVYFGSSLYNE